MYKKAIFLIKFEAFERYLDESVADDEIWREVNLNSVIFE